MAGNKFLILDPATNLAKETPGTQTSAGVANANEIPALNSAGVLDITLMPPGVGSSAQSIVASEALSAGALVQIWPNAGVANVRNANATDATKPADGFVLAAVASLASATVYFPGQLVTGVSGLTIGAPVFLSTVSGGVTVTAPSAAGNLVQQVGTALSATSFIFQPMAGIIKG